MKQLLIYVPGLGNEKTVNRQRIVVKKWGDKNTDSLFLEPNWQDKNEDFLTKLKRLTKSVSTTDLNKYDAVTIVGTSAGGSMGLNVFNEFKTNPKVRLISVCGKLRNVENIGWQYQSKNPAFIDSVIFSEKVQQSLLEVDKKRILAVIPLFDEVVRKQCMYFDGIETKRQYTLGHVISIAYAILFKVNSFKKF